MRSNIVRCRTVIYDRAVIGAEERPEDSVVAAVLAGLAFRSPAGKRHVVPSGIVRELVTGVHGPLGRPAVSLHGCRIVGDVDLSYLEWRGRVDLIDCQIDGDLILSYTRIMGHVGLSGSRVREVLATNLDLVGSLHFRRGLAKRGFSGIGMTIAGSLSLQDTVLVAPSSGGRAALNMYRSRVADLFLRDAQLIGGLYAPGLIVTRAVRLAGMTALSRLSLGLPTDADTADGAAVNLTAAKIGGGLYLFSEVLGGASPRFGGVLRLSRAHCARFRARPEDLAGTPLRIDGFTFDRIDGMDPEEWLNALELNEVGPEPYRHLASLAAAQGRFDLERDTRIALQRRQDEELHRSHLGRLRRWLLRVTVGYGYQPARALAWLAVVVVACMVLLLLCGDFFVARGLNGHHGFDNVSEATAFTLDNLLPFANLGNNAGWSAQPHGVGQTLALLVFVALKGMAWALVGLGLGATTGLIRRD